MGSGSDEMVEVVVRRDDLRAATVRSRPRDDGAGVVLRIDRFALTANNVTYAVTGDALGYWRFFPTGDDGSGIVPAWGVGTVVASDAADVRLGERWYGYVPMASHLRVEPGQVTPTDVVDTSAHRADLAGIYQRYSRLHADPLHDEAMLDLELLYRPLFLTAFLLAEVVTGGTATNGDGGGHEVVVITSASSKTGMALAHLLRDRDVTVAGLTSPGNVAHVADHGLHDLVLAYDELDGLSRLDGRAAVVDLAGRRDVILGAHAQLPGMATHLVVGITHHDTEQAATASRRDMPQPTTFFAPARAAALVRRWGPSVLMERVAASWRPFLAEVGVQVRIAELPGLAAVPDAWARLVAGEIDPATGLIVVAS